MVCWNCLCTLCPSTSMCSHLNTTEVYKRSLYDYHKPVETETMLYSFLWLCKSLVYLMHKSLSVSLSHSWVLGIIWSLADIYPMVWHCDNIHKLFPYHWNLKLKLDDISCMRPILSKQLTFNAYKFDDNLSIQ